MRIIISDEQLAKMREHAQSQEPVEPLPSLWGFPVVRTDAVVPDDLIVGNYVDAEPGEIEPSEG